MGIRFNFFNCEVIEERVRMSALHNSVDGQNVCNTEVNTLPLMMETFQLTSEVLQEERSHNVLPFCACALMTVNAGT